jgi:hypothetical protein
MGQQQYHCRACGIYTVTDDRARKRAIKMKLVEKLHRAKRTAPTLVPTP